MGYAVKVTIKNVYITNSKKMFTHFVCILLHVMWLFCKENVIVTYEQSKVVGTSSDPALAPWSFLLVDNKRDLGFHALLVAVVLMGYYDILSKNFLLLLT